jgi:ATP-binding cassette subfamily B multidrug efflux pump
MRSLSVLLKFLKPYRRWALLAPALMALEVAMDLMQPRLLQHIIDQGVAKNDVSLVVRQGSLMIVCAVVGLIGGLGCGVFAVLAAQGTGADLRKAAFAKVQTLSFGNLDRLQTGGLITRLTNDVTQIQDAVQMILRIMVRTPLLLVGSLVMGYLTSPKLSLLFLFLMPAVLLVILWITRKLFPLFGVVQQRLDRLNSVLQENLSGIRVIKAFARSGHEIQRFRGANVDLTETNVTTARFGAVTMPLMMLILNAGLVATLWFGGYQVSRGSLEVGQIVAFTNYLAQTLMSLMMFSMVVIRLSRAEASAKRIREVLDDVPDVAPPASPAPDFEAQGRVEFKNVTFSYEGDGADPVLCDISLTAEARPARERPPSST